jgi:acetyl esterase
MEKCIRTDPRVDPRLKAELARLNLDVPFAEPPVWGDAPPVVLNQLFSLVECMLRRVQEGCVAGLEPVRGMTCTTITIKGSDDNPIPLYVHQPSGPRTALLPCILHLHPGCMSIMESGYESNMRWRDELAALGAVVVGVEHRNACGRLGAFPFPAGLNDCIAALQWVDTHRAKLGISKIVINGCGGGGGNLALSTAMRAKQLGLSCIAGVYVQGGPMISNMYNCSPEQTKYLLPSLSAFDGYIISLKSMDCLGGCYTPVIDGKRSRDPLAWPLWADPADLVGLPPHCFSLNELDPFYDEGMMHYRAMLRSGVTASCRTIHGVTHESDYFMARVVMPEVHRGLLCDIVLFAQNV